MSAPFCPIVSQQKVTLKNLNDWIPGDSHIHFNVFINLFHEELVLGFTCFVAHETCVSSYFLVNVSLSIKSQVTSSSLIERYMVECMLCITVTDKV